MALPKAITELIPLLEESEIEEVLVLTIEHHVPIPRIKSFEINSMVDEFCKLNFRFYKDDILRLKRALEFNGKITCGNGIKVSSVEALCITLRRLAYPNRYVDLMKLFPRTRCELSRIFNTTIRKLHNSHGHLLNLGHPYLSMNKIESFTNAIAEKGSPYKRCFGFLDGTVRAMCRPQLNQREYYNGHKRVHAIKFQSVMLPDGIVGSLYGPVDGRRHDSYLLQQSRILEDLEQRYFNAQGQPIYLYGDPAYPLRRHLIVPFKGHNLTTEKNICNKKMSQVRQSVEWGFAKIIATFAYLDFKKNLKHGLQPLSLYYKVATLLTNCHTCIYGSLTSDYFAIDPPELEVYLQ